MNFDEIQRRLESAKGEPQALALATLDIVLADRDPRLRTAIEAAAIPHWFDAAVLAALLPEEAGDPIAMMEQLKALPIMEAFQARQGWNVHDTTRLALRVRLAREDPARFVHLSAAAASYFVGYAPWLEVERIYHRLSAAPEGADELNLLWKRWDQDGRTEALQALGVVLDELMQTDHLAAATEARVCYCLWTIRQKWLPLNQQRSLAERALKLLEQIGDEYGAKNAHNALRHIYLGSMYGWQLIAKRLLDIVGSGLCLVLLFPILLAAAIMIKLTSPGPVLFVQERAGLNKRLFRMYKFRTMVQGAEKMQKALERLNEVGGPVFKIRNDPRITRVGRVLQKTSIDELPQFFNVLKGDMSLVGPRPLPVRDYKGFSEDWHRRRFSVKPGITCLWQIAGPSDLDFNQTMKLDMFYIDHWSLWLDIKILLRTSLAVLQSRGAA